MKKMYKPLTIEFVISNENLPFWENLNKERYFDILSITPINERSNMAEVQIDLLYISFLFGDVFHEGVKAGMKAIVDAQKTLK